MAKKFPDTYMRDTGDKALHEALDKVIKSKAASVYGAGTTPTLTQVNTLLTNLTTYADNARTIENDPKSAFPA